MRVCIDPGHGGSDSGAVGINGLLEKTINLNIALKVQQYLKRAGFVVGLTRDKDEFVSLEQRVKTANSGFYNAFISIHCNSSTGGVAEGLEIWYPNNVGVFNWESNVVLAYILQKSLLISSGAKDRGLKTMTEEQKEFYVLRNTLVPAALVECGFLSSFKEATLLGEEFYMEKISLGIFQALSSFVKL